MDPHFKAQVFVREHQDHAAIWKLRMNKPRTAGDFAEVARPRMAARRVAARSG
jgi:hypothetical protein